MQDRKTKLAAIGVMFSCIGISSVGVIKILVGRNVQWLSIVVVISSILLMVTSQQMRYYINPNRGVWLIFIYSFVTVVLSAITDVSMYNTGFSFVYQAAYLIQIILVWNLQDRIVESKLVSCVIHVGGVATVLCLFFLLRYTSGSSLFFNTIYNKADEFLINRSTTGTLGFVTLSAVLAYKTNKKTASVHKWTILVSCIVLIIISGRRSVYLAVIAAVILYVRNSKYELKEKSKSAIKPIMKWTTIILIVLILFRFIPGLGEIIDRMWYLLMNGIKTFLGLSSSNNADLSAQMRVTAASQTIEEFFNNSTISQVIFGRGYMNKWIDIPILQAFWDLGIIGGIWYVLNRIIYTGSLIIQTTTNSTTCFAQYFTVLSVFESLANGCPYGVFFSVVLLAACKNAEKR